MTTRPLGAQISHMLKNRGVDVIFGIPGVHNQEMYRGIEEAGITHVLARHEQGAGFMADGYARASGKPGIAYVITGPGLCNIMTPMGQAYSDSVPVLVISSCLDETAARRGQLHQMLDQETAARTVCDWSYEARSATAVYELTDRALAEFAGARPRSKHIQVPIGTLEAQAPAAPPPPRPGMSRAAPPEMVDMVAEALNAAERPLLVLGGGCVDGADLWREVLQRTGAASFTTYAGKGIAAPDDPLFFGSYLELPDSADQIAKADLVLAVGTELAEVDLWRVDLGHKARFMRVDIDPSQLNSMPQTADGLLCDAAALAEGLLARDLRRATGWQASDVAATRARWQAEVDMDAPGVLPVVQALQAVLPDETMIYSDMTTIAYAALQLWDMPRAGHWHHPFGFGTLGYAMPAAIGGAMARKGKPTLAIAGDYGFQYTVQELGAAVEMKLPLPIIVWDNGKLLAIENSMISAQIAPNSVIAHNPDFCALARAYGARAEAPETLEALQAAVLAAFEADGPTLIYVTPDLGLEKTS